MKVNRCIHCMQEMGAEAAVCPHCGERQECPPGYDGLRPNTILHGRYLTGLRAEENTYIAFDLAEGKRMSVKEFFPRFQASRAGNDLVPSPSGGEWDKGLEEFLRLGGLLLQQPPDLNLPRVLEVFQENGTAYIALRGPALPKGISLYDKLKNDRVQVRGGLAFSMYTHLVLRPAAESLKWLHQNGLLHRNIGPYGITWPAGSDDSGPGLPFPLPSGEARGGGHRAGVSAPGRIDPFSPVEEFQQKGDRGPWTDVYSLCAVLYFCVTGHEPPDAISRAHEGEWTAPLPDLPADLSRSQRAVLEDGMALQPKDRIQSIDELLRRVDESLKSPGGFDPAQNIPQVVYGPPPQENDAPNACPSCGFRWKSPVMLPKPKFCPHCGKKLPGGAG